MLLAFHGIEILATNWSIFMNSALRPFAVVTGGSTGIGFELARECLENGYDVLIAADRDVESAKQRLSSFGGTVEAIETDLATPEGVEELCSTIAGRPVDALLANAGHGLGKGFLDQDFGDINTSSIRM